jgi:hypothetical protein
MHTHTYTHAHIHTHAYTHTHTHIDLNVQLTRSTTHAHARPLVSHEDVTARCTDAAPEIRSGTLLAFPLPSIPPAYFSVAPPLT